VGNSTTYEYDNLGRLTAETETDAEGGVTAYTYDAVGNRLSLTDAVGNTTGWAYDDLDRLADRMLATFQASDFARPEGMILGVEEELRGPVLPGCPDLLARVDLIQGEGTCRGSTRRRSGSASLRPHQAGRRAGVAGDRGPALLPAGSPHELHTPSWGRPGLESPLVVKGRQQRAKKLRGGIQGDWGSPCTVVGQKCQQNPIAVMLVPANAAPADGARLGLREKAADRGQRSPILFLEKELSACPREFTEIGRHSTTAWRGLPRPGHRCRKDGP